MDECVWRVNLAEGRIRREPVPGGWVRLGGRGLIARVLLDEIDPSCDPLGPGNKLLWASGLLVGHMLSSCDRISVGAKSPLTGGIKESNAGGSTGLKLAYLGIKALVLEGALPASGWWLLHLSAAGGELQPADDLAGLGVHEAAHRLLERFGKKVGLALIGPGGEMRLQAAGIQNLDKDNEPSRINARGGLGAVMGARRLKAVVIDASQGERPPLVDPEGYKAAQKRFTQELMAHPQTAIYRDYGTAGLAAMVDGFGALPTCSFSTGHFEGIEGISGEHMRDVLLARGKPSDTSHACMAGCTIRSSNVFGSAQGEKIVSPLEYETIGLVGSNLGIGDLDQIAHLNAAIDDLGLDSIEIGAALGVAAEAGQMEFGDASGAMRLVDEIRGGTPLGRVLGSGAAVTGRVFGIRRVAVVKGQAMASYDPRAIKGTGVTYATSPQGADHTAGLTIRAKVDHLKPEGQAELSRGIQINMA
ncbi:MAG: aldehyde ferredoxin oxidoreductase, partial [Anaerolineales bacterium]|nr:aldehyde ferredoxin oxidoreductase [Anaerolineales bacterium]